METDETGNEATRALVRPSVDGEAWTKWTPQIQNAGVDSLEFSFDIEIGQAMWDRLEEEKAIAPMLMQTRKAEYVPNWLNAVVRPVGAKGGYRFLLETPTFSIKLLKGVPNRPPIYVEMRAYGLHTHEGGAIGACEAACAFIRDTLLADEDPEWTAKVINLDAARCSRLDLFMDWQGGWHPTFEVNDENGFIKRVHAEVGRYSVNGKVNGYEIGKSAVRGRVYNKTVPCKKKHVEWYPTLLQVRNGLRYNAEQDLWRVEFQLRREGVKGFRLYAKPEMTDPDDVIDAEIEAEDLPHIHSVRKALHWAGRIWEYLTKRWLRLTIPTDDPNRGRWPEHPTWTALRDGFAPLALRDVELPDHSLDLVRATRYTGYRRLLDRMAVGLTTTLEQMDTDPGAALVSYVGYLHRIAGRIKRQQNKRTAAWQRKEQETSRLGHPSSLVPDLERGLGARLDTPTRAEKRWLLLDMALGVFSSAGVVHLRMQREADVSNLGDLLLLQRG
ncbi:MAG TPA: hypothetical protein VGP82_24785 [Ktedonobacterales bacterium]|nr:hypothetical protein [Ktedonobacterales bacterium]